MKRDTQATAALVIACSLFSALAVYSAAQPTLPKCQAMVISDLKNHQAYAAQLAGIVSPDFLTAMGVGRK